MRYSVLHIFFYRKVKLMVTDFIGFIEEEKKNRDEDPTFFSMNPDPAQREKKSGSRSDLKSK